MEKFKKELQNVIQIIREHPNGMSVEEIFSFFNTISKRTLQLNKPKALQFISEFIVKNIPLEDQKRFKEIIEIESLMDCMKAILQDSKYGLRNFLNGKKIGDRTPLLTKSHV